MVGMPRSNGVRARQRPVTARKPTITEKAFQAQVERYARLCGWLVYHTWNSMRSAPGFPDLVCLKNGRMVVAELKSERGQTTEAQDRWLAQFLLVPGARVFVWRPTEEDWQAIEQVLGRAA